MLIIGEKEVRTDSVSVRSRDDGDLGNMAIGEFLAAMRCVNCK